MEAVGEYLSGASGGRDWREKSTVHLFIVGTIILLFASGQALDAASIATPLASAPLDASFLTK